MAADVTISAVTVSPTVEPVLTPSTSGPDLQSQDAVTLAPDVMCPPQVGGGCQLYTRGY